MSITQNAFFTKTLILFKIENLLQIFGGYLSQECRFSEDAIRIETKKHRSAKLKIFLLTLVDY